MADPPAQKKAKLPSTLKLYYADMNFWRAECVRMAFFLGDVEFEDVRNVDRHELKKQGKLPFGAVPVLEVEDGKILSQTQAMAVYAAHLAGIAPDDPWLEAKVDECLNGCTDVTGTIGTTFRIQEEAEKIAARKALIDSASGGRLWMHLNGLDHICAQNKCAKGYSVGTEISVADLAIWRLVGWIDSGKLDGIPLNYASDTFPALNKLVAAVNDHPKVQEWKAKYPKYYGEKK